MKHYYLVPLMFITACSSGSDTNSTTALFDAANSVPNNGCEQEYYQTIIGEYRGFIELIESELRTPRVCSWEASVSITGESIASTCQLRASTQGTVTQSTFYPDDDLERYQCIDDIGLRTVLEPFGINLSPLELPGLDNSLFPIDISFSRNSAAPNTGPIFGDEAMIGTYLYLHDSSQSRIARQIRVDGANTLTFRTSDGLFLGTLNKE